MIYLLKLIDLNSWIDEWNEWMKLQEMLIFCLNVSTNVLLSSDFICFQVWVDLSIEIDWFELMNWWMKWMKWFVDLNCKKC